MHTVNLSLKKCSEIKYFYKLNDEGFLVDLWNCKQMLCVEKEICWKDGSCLKTGFFCLIDD